MHDRHEDIQKSYKQLGDISNVYDGIITRSTLIGKLADSVIWGLDKELAAKWINDALEPIPQDFSGKLLEVPVGTGVLTVPVYKTFKNTNITFIQGDVGQLPFSNETFDIVLSLNGFHAFPDKDAAYKETCRVLKKGGIFCGCFYIAKEFDRTDWFVKHMYVPKGFFTPPFETKESLRKRLKEMYSEVEVHSVNSEGIFRCIK